MLEVETSWVEVDGTGQRWMHGLVIPDVLFRQEKSFLVEYIYLKRHYNNKNIDISSLKYL